MIILAFLNAIFNNLSTFKTGFHRLCIKTSAEDEKFLKCNLNQKVLDEIVIKISFQELLSTFSSYVYSKLLINHTAHL